RMLPVPVVDLGLQAVAFGKQFAVLGGQIVHQLVETRPEGGGVQAGARQGFFLDESIQFGGNLQPVAGGSLAHDGPLNDGMSDRLPWHAVMTIRIEKNQVELNAMIHPYYRYFQY